MRRTARRSRRWPLVVALLLLALLVSVVGLGLAAWAAAPRAAVEYLGRGCDLAAQTPRELGATSFVYAADGTYLGPIRAETYRIPVPVEEVSPWVGRATVAAEDRTFWTNDGIDPRAIVRAAIANERAGAIVQGASTITQQVARLRYLDQAQTLERKRREACLAIRLNETLTKRQILGDYLNRAYYGHRAYGVEAAAQTYFGRKARSLGPARAALLAGLPQAPSRFDPLRNPEAALARRNAVLRAMRDVGELTPAQYRKAVAAPLGLRPGTLFTTRRHGEFLRYVRRLLVDRYGERVVRTGGLRIRTTLLPREQRLAKQAIARNLPEPGDPAAALASVDPRTGAVRALVSRAPQRPLQYNIAVDGRRQAGSAFKTFVLAEALRLGANPYSTRYRSAPFRYDRPDLPEPWEPKTYSGTYAGPLSLVEATVRSDNIVFAKLTLDVGPAAVARLARRLGVRSELAPVASIGLGSNGVSPLDMASAYATLAAGGVYREPYVVWEVTDAGGSSLPGVSWGPSEPRRVLHPNVAYWVTRVLEQNVERGTGRRADLERPNAGKTGTTDDYGDAWFVGYVPQRATAVWVGYERTRRPMLDVHGLRVSGGTIPAEIWGEHHRRALAPLEPRPFAKPQTTRPWTPWRGSRRYVQQQLPPVARLEP